MDVAVAPEMNVATNNESKDNGKRFHCVLSLAHKHFAIFTPPSIDTSRDDQIDLFKSGIFFKCFFLVASFLSYEKYTLKA